ncbi:hypothetical protein L218DRAFT_253205 [Marasmius fiardii PR-910]|nr:hypothetical protein L218DRAFT_253205 [Marasmius fiardii PR-910]
MPDPSSSQTAKNHQPVTPFIIILAAFGMFAIILVCASRWRYILLGIHNRAYLYPYRAGVLVHHDKEKPPLFDLWTRKDEASTWDNIMPLSAMYWKNENAPLPASKTSSASLKRSPSRSRKLASNTI